MGESAAAVETGATVLPAPPDKVAAADAGDDVFPLGAAALTGLASAAGLAASTGAVAVAV